MLKEEQFKNGLLDEEFLVKTLNSALDKTDIAKKQDLDKLKKELVEAILPEIKKELEEKYGLILKELTDIKNNQKQLMKIARGSLSGGKRSWIIFKKVMQYIVLGVKKFDKEFIQTDRDFAELIYKDADGKWQKKELKVFFDEEVEYLHESLMKEIANDKNLKSRMTKKLLADNLIRCEIKEKGSRSPLISSFSYGEWTGKIWNEFAKKKYMRLDRVLVNEPDIKLLTTDESIPGAMLAKPGIYGCWKRESWKYFSPEDYANGITKGQVIDAKLKALDSTKDWKKIAELNAKKKKWNQILAKKTAEEKARKEEYEAYKKKLEEEKAAKKAGKKKAKTSK